jgi:2'-5' RNA ligase
VTETRRVRLFVALELPDPWRAALSQSAAALERSAPGVARWVDSALMHVTLVFLGGQDPARLSSIQAAVDAAAAESPEFTLRLSAPGAFGGRRSLRVIWVGVDDRPPGALTRLQQSVAGRLRDAGLDFDDSPFRAHVTLGRAQRAASPSQSEAMHRAVTGGIGGAAVLGVEGFEVEQVSLIRSDLRPTGPIYTPLHRAPLAGRGL